MPNIEEEFFTYTISYSTQPKSAEDKNNFSINYELLIDPYMEKVERSYLKLDGMLANIGSIIFISEFLTQFFTEIFSQGNLEYKLYKNIFYIKKDKKPFKTNLIKREYEKITNIKNNLDKKGNFIRMEIMKEDKSLKINDIDLENFDIINPESKLKIFENSPRNEINTKNLEKIYSKTHKNENVILYNNFQNLNFNNSKNLNEKNFFELEKKKFKQRIR